MRLLLAAGDFNTLAVSVFAVVLAITLLITRWAARRTRTATEFWAAGRGISGTQNGFAIAGDYLSASTFLGYAGLIFLFGFDGWIIGLAALVSFRCSTCSPSGCATRASTRSRTCSATASSSARCGPPRR
jgi:cation/acetate symporter